MTWRLRLLLVAHPARGAAALSREAALQPASVVAWAPHLVRGDRCPVPGHNALLCHLLAAMWLLLMLLCVLLLRGVFQ